MGTLNATAIQTDKDSGKRAKRRQAAYATLSPLVSGPQLMEALWLLEEEYKDALDVAMVDYFLTVTERFNIDERAGYTLMPAFHKYIKGSDDALPPDPMPLMANFRGQAGAGGASSAAGSNGSSAEMVVFDAVVNNISTQISTNENFAKFREWLKDEVGRADLTGPAREAMHAWCDSPGISLAMTPLAEKEAATIVHLVYLALCHIFGPVTADKRMSRAIERVSLLPEADVFSPRALL